MEEIGSERAEATLARAGLQQGEGDWIRGVGPHWCELDCNKERVIGSGGSKPHGRELDCRRLKAIGSGGDKGRL